MGCCCDVVGGALKHSEEVREASSPSTLQFRQPNNGVLSNPPRERCKPGKGRYRSHTRSDAPECPRGISRQAPGGRFMLHSPPRPQTEPIVAMVAL